MGTEAQLHFHKTSQSPSPFNGLIRQSFPALNSVCLLHFQVLWPLATCEGQRLTCDLLPHLPFTALCLHSEYWQSLEHLVNPERLLTHSFQHGQSQPSPKTNQREGCGSGAFLTPTSHALSPSNGYRHVKHAITVRKQHKRTCCRWRGQS